MTDLMLPAIQIAGLDPIPEPSNAALALAPDLHHNEHLATITWKTLAPLMAAQPTMRLWNPGVRFNESTDLTKALPAKPAAVPIFWMNRTRLLALDLDAKRWGAAAVLEDLVGLRALLKECGAHIVVDFSVSGGAHILIPLQIAVTRVEIEPLLQALAARYKTLDLLPMQGDTGFGCITVPGSRCREGGFRVLEGSLAAAGEAFRVPNPPEVLHRLAGDLGADPVVPDVASSSVEDVDHAVFFHGEGVNRRLRDTYHLQVQMPKAISKFAETGQLPKGGRWQSPSEARQSVLYYAMGSGLSLGDVINLMAPGAPWAQGLPTAYSRYKYSRAIHKALQYDWDKAFRHHLQRCRIFHARTHKTLHTGVLLSSAPHQTWLAHAIWWCDTTLRSEPGRWSAAAVLQALAVGSVLAGEVVNGTPTVAVGVRSLSLATGLLSKETVAAGLRMLREYPGAPVLLIQEGNWLIPDGYALVTPDAVDPAPDAADRPQLRAVHDAWWVIGAHHRRVFESIEASGPLRAADLVAAARMSPSAVYDSLAELCRRGLLQKQGSLYAVGATSLDDIAEQWRVADERARRIERHRAERAEWKSFVEGSGQALPPVPEQVPEQENEMDLVLSPWDEADYLKSVMADGPPVTREEAYRMRGHRRRGGVTVNSACIKHNQNRTKESHNYAIIGALVR